MNRNQTIWASLDEIRIGERTVSRLSASTVELYRRWLEQGREAPPVRLARQVTRSLCVTADIAWPRLWRRDAS